MAELLTDTSGHFLLQCVCKTEHLAVVMFESLNVIYLVFTKPRERVQGLLLLPFDSGNGEEQI